MSLADVWHQGHEAGALDGVLDGALERGAVAAALAAEDLTLAGAELFQCLHVLVIDERGARATLFRTETAAVLPALAKLFANHRGIRLVRVECWSSANRGGTVKIAIPRRTVNETARSV